MTKSDTQKKFIVVYIPEGSESVGAEKHASSWHSSRGRKLRKHTFYYKHKGEGLEIGLAYIISKPTPRSVLRPSMLHHLSKQHHPLGTKCSDIQVYGRHFSSKTP